MSRASLLIALILLANLGLAAFLMLQERPALLTGPEPLPQTGEGIQLLSELPHSRPAPRPRPRACRVWGPEQSREAFDALAAELVSIGAFPEIRATKVYGEPDFLVYVRGLASRDRAGRVAKELDGLGIESYLMSDDDGAPVVSVGLFSRYDLATRQQQRVAGLGYDVFVQTVERAQTVYELVAHVAPDHPLHQSSTSACGAIAQRN